eukprot:sb/3465993/
MASYALWLLVTTPALWGIPHYYKREWCALALDKSEFVKTEMTGWSAVKFYAIVLAIPIFLILPIPITAFSTTISLFKLWQNRQGRVSVNQFGMPVPPRRMISQSARSGVTIMIFAVIYMTLNLPYGIFYLYVQYEAAKRGVGAAKVITNPIIKCYVCGVTHILSITLNAFLNPIVYYTRLENFSAFVKNSVNIVRGKVYRIFRIRSGGEQHQRERPRQLNQKSADHNKENETSAMESIHRKVSTLKSNLPGADPSNGHTEMGIELTKLTPRSRPQSTSIIEIITTGCSSQSHIEPDFQILKEDGCSAVKILNLDGGVLVKKGSPPDYQHNGCPGVIFHQGLVINNIGCVFSNEPDEQLTQV